MLPLLALLPLCVAGATHTSYELAVRSEARASTDTLSQTFSLIDLTPRAGLRLASSSVFFNLAYAPRVALMSGGKDTVPELMHRAELGLEYAFTPGRRLFFRQDAAYGMREFTLLGAASPTAQPTQSPQTTPTPAPAPNQIDNQRLVGFAPYVQSSSRAGLVLELSKLWTLVADGGYELSGGADPATRTALPLQRGPRFDALLTYLATARDTFTTTASGSDAVFSNGRRASLIVVDERWRRAIGRGSFGELRAGVSTQRQQTERGTTTLATLPVGGVAFETAASLAGLPLSSRIELNVVPYIDPYAAVVYQRLEANALFNWKISHLTVLGRGAASFALSGFERRGQALLTADVGATYAFDTHVQIEAGVRGAFQNGALISSAVWALGGYVALAFNQLGAL